MTRVKRRLWMAAVICAAAAAARAAPPTPLISAPSKRGLPPAAAAADAVLARAVASGTVPGAVIAVVQDGRPVYVRGYGVTDKGSGRPMDPERSLVRVGSVSKLFNALAVMRQVEAGRLALDRDIRTEVDTPLKLPEGAVTLRHLLSHRGGFEDAVKDLFVGEPRPLQPLPAYLATHQPAQVRAPGLFPAYSNYGASLAGYAAARASGRPYEEMMEEEVFAPLGMHRSTFRQPPPQSLSADVVTGYIGGRAVPFERVQAMPGGGMSTTAADMTRFLLAMTGAPAIGTHLPVMPATLAEMTSPAWPSDPAEPGLGLGFMRDFHGGELVLEHNGDLRAIGAAVRIVPSRRFAIFIACSASPGGNVADKAASAALDALLGPVRHVAALPDAARIAPRLDGTYADARRHFASPLALGVLLKGAVRVRSDAGGRLYVGAGRTKDGRPRPWLLLRRTPHAFVYGDATSGAELWVRETPGVGFVLHPEPHISYAPLEWTHDPAWQTPALVALAALSLIASIAGLVASARAGRGFAALAAGPLLLTATAAYGGTLLAYAADRAHLTALSDRNDGWLAALYVLAWTAVAGAVVSLVAGARLWRPSGVAARGLIVLTAVTAAAGVWELWIWRFLSFAMAY